MIGAGFIGASAGRRRRPSPSGGPVTVAPAQMAAPAVTASGSTLVTVTLAADPYDGGTAIIRRDLRWREAGGSWAVQTGIISPVTLDALTPDTDYEVQTRVANAVGAGSWSVAGTARTQAIPTTFSRVVFVGASIVRDVFGNDLTARNGAAEAAFAAAGATVEVYANAVDGEDAGAAAARLTEAMAAFPSDTLFFVHTGGNNASANRPYPGGAATLSAQMNTLIDIASIRPGTVILSDLTFRDYDDTTAQDEAAGSKPYNDDLLQPLFASRKAALVARAYYGDGTPVSCLYEWSFYNRDTYLSADNIHPSGAGIASLRAWLAQRLTPICTNAALPAQATRITLDGAAPVLSAAGGQASGETGATALRVTTNEAGGMLYWGVFPEAENPTGADVITGAGAAIGGAQAVLSAGLQTVPDQSGLATDTGYRAWYMHEDAAGNRSTPVASNLFATDAPVAGPGLTEIFVQYGTNTATGVNTPAFNDFDTNAGNTSDGPFDLLNTDGSDPGIQLTLNYSAPSSGDANGFGINPAGRSTGVSGFDGSLYNDVFTTQSFYVGAANTLEHVISGLAPDTGYTVELVASRNAGGSRETLYSFSSGQSATLETTASPVDGPVSVNAVSDGTGVIAITQSANTGSWSYLGGVRIIPTPVVTAGLSLEETGEEPVITASGGTLSVTLAGGVYAGTYSTRATDGAALTVEMIEAAPTPIVLPVVSGSAAEGQTLTATPGLWLYDGPDPGDQTWQWQNDTDGSITGETTLSYLLQTSDVGDTVSVDETFGGVTVSSPSTGTIAASSGSGVSITNNDYASNYTASAGIPVTTADETVSMDFGPAVAGRDLYVFVSGLFPPGGTDLSIDGVSATRVTTVDGQGGLAHGVALYKLQSDTIGGAVDVVAFMNGNNHQEVAFVAYTTEGVARETYATASETSGGSSVSADITDQGAVIACASNINGGASAWVGVTEDHDNEIRSGEYVTAASASALDAETGRTVSVTPSTNNPGCMIVASLSAV